MRGGGPKKVDTLLERYQRTLRAPQGSVIKAFQEVAKQECGFVLEKDVVSYAPATRTLSVRVAGPRKQELLLHKATILKLMEKELGAQNAPHHLI